LAINKYISLAPDEANPYDTRGDLYAHSGKIDQAIESYKEALERKPDFDFSLANLGIMYLFKREYAKAESYYKQLCSSSEKDIRSWGRLLLASVPVHQGKFEQALKVLDDGVAADRMEQAEGWANANKHHFKAIIYAEKKNLNLALKEAEIGRQILEKAIPEKITWRPLYARILAESREITEAEELARVLKNDIEEKDPTGMFYYWLTLGYIELAKRNPKTAVTCLEKADQEATAPFFHIRLSLARAYLESGRLGEAVGVFENTLSRYDRTRASYYAIEAVKAHYLLGLAYEKSGWSKKAIEQYEEFLEIWKDADPGIPEVEDAKERLNRLKAES